MKVKEGQIYKNVTSKGLSYYDIVKVLNTKKSNFGENRIIFKIIKNKGYRDREGLEYNVSLEMFSSFFKIYNLKSKIKRLN